MCVFLLVFPFFTQPGELFIGLGIISTGVPFYLIFVAWKNKPQLISRPWSKYFNLDCVVDAGSDIALIAAPKIRFLV